MSEITATIIQHEVTGAASGKQAGEESIDAEGAVRLASLVVPPADSTGSVRPDSPPIGFLERLPKWLICVPLLLQWIALGLRHRSFMLPSLANPKITAGGLLGEGKSEYFAAMGPHGRAATAVNGVFVVNAGSASDEARACMQRLGLAFPIIAKPDVGWCGFGVRKIESAVELDAYLRAFPLGERVVLQKYVAQPGEAGAFYVRRPGEQTGGIIGLALREFPRVIGDGRSSMAQLLAANPRTARLTRDGLHDFQYAPDEVPDACRVVRLATIGSTRVGGLYRDGARLITPALSAAIDAIAGEMDFHFGRFDLRFATEAALQAGQFSIIEVNGAGSEAIEAWDPATPPLTAFGKIFAKQRLLFEISAAHRRRGLRPIGMLQLLRLHLRQQKLILQYPPSN
jgi:hypothetical protein